MIVRSGKSEISVGQLSRLEIQVRFDIAVVSPKSLGQGAGNSGRISRLQS